MTTYIITPINGSESRPLDPTEHVWVERCGLELATARDIKQCCPGAARTTQASCEAAGLRLCGGSGDIIMVDSGETDESGEALYEACRVEIASDTVRSWGVGPTDEGGYRIILDNGGGVTLQLGGVYGHHYESADQAAADLREWVDTGSTDGWEGHEVEALKCEPTADEIRNGGYLIVRDWRELDGCEWANGSALYRAMSRAPTLPQAVAEALADLTIIRNDRCGPHVTDVWERLLVAVEWITSGGPRGASPDGYHVEYDGRARFSRAWLALDRATANTLYDYACAHAGRR